MSYGMVYMGSKEKILPLIDYIMQREYDKEYFIDLFGGGFSVSGYALKNTNFNVIYNDLNEYLVSLIIEMTRQKGKNLKKRMLNFVTRKDFEDVRDNPDNYSPSYVGFVLNAYSFGCNQKDYLYSKELELYKYALHQSIVFGDYKMLNNIPSLEKFYIEIKEPMEYSRNKRLYFMDKYKSFVRASRDKYLNSLNHQLPHLNMIEKIYDLKKYYNNYQKLYLFSHDYKNMIEDLYDEEDNHILKNCFIYCDIPYQDSKQYKFGTDFNHEEFWQWFRDCPYPVYVSSYKAPDDIKPLNFEYKIQNLDNGKRSYENKKVKKVVQENIYFNGKGTPTPTLFDDMFNK